MGNCFKTMIVYIGLFGVNPTAYSNFVDSTIGTAMPSNNDIANAYANSVTNTSSYIVLLVLIVVFIVFMMITVILLSEQQISKETAAVLITACLALVTVYYILARDSFFTLSKETMLRFQEEVSDTVIYTGNSVLRDVIYLALCK